MAAEGAAPPTRRSRILEVLEVLAKLLGASAVLVVALIANSVQSKITGVSIQSQREQAESQLRASMFGSLIAPLSGPQSDKPIPADREVLLTELLALNFSENFEMKPLMEDANKRLAEEYAAKGSKSNEDPREILWSIARRISERQKSSIAREWSASEASNASSWLPSWISSASSGPTRCQFYTINLNSDMERHDEPVPADEDTCVASAAFTDIVRLKSPDGNYTLHLVAVHPNWADQTVSVSAQPFLSVQGSPKSTDTQYKFPLTWLDLPLTDNTPLSDGNRFAVYLRTFYDKNVTITVMWFPKGYFTPRERPLNYNDLQRVLGTSQK